MQHELRMSADQVRDLVRSGALPVLRILDVWRVESAAVDRLIDRARDASWSADGWCDRAARPPVGPGDDGLGTAATSGGPPSPPTTPDRPRPHVAEAAPPAEGAPCRRLTEQQRRVLTLVGEGLPNDEIAARLSLQVSTVKSHVARLLQRLDLPDRGRLIAYAWRLGLLEP